MKCPHCIVEFHATPKQIYLEADLTTEWGAESYICPKCHKIIIYLVSGRTSQSLPGVFTFSDSSIHILVYPKGSNRTLVSPEVPSNLAVDYNEACLVLPDSPKASAALSRRCLQKQN